MCPVTRARKGTASVHGGQVSYRVYEGGPDVLVLLHGIGRSGRIFANQVQAFHRDFTIVLPDLRGHGESSTFTDPGQAHIDQHCRDLETVLSDVQATQVYAAGVSMGGMIAQRYAATRPDRVRKLVLDSTSPNMRTACRDSYGGWVKQTFRRPIFWALSKELDLEDGVVSALGTARAYAQRAGKTAGALARRMRGEEPAEYTFRDAQKPPPKHCCYKQACDPRIDLSWVRHLLMSQHTPEGRRAHRLQFNSMMGWDDLADLADEHPVTCDTQILHAEHDSHVPLSSAYSLEACLSRHARVEFHLFEGMRGHGMLTHVPQRANPLVYDFLKRPASELSKAS